MPPRNATTSTAQADPTTPTVSLTTGHLFRGGSWEMLHTQLREVVISGPAGTGKAQPLDSTVWTPTGPKRMGDVRLGDVVCHPTAGQSIVLQIHPQGECQVYRLTFSCGEQVECTEDHLWTVKYIGGGHRGGNVRREFTKTLPLSEIMKDYRIGKRRSRPKYWIPQTQPVAFNPQPVPIDPYVLGVLLGDGCLRNNVVSFSSADSQLVEEVRAALGDRYVLKFDGRFAYRISANGKWVVKKARGKPGQISKAKVGKPYIVQLRQPGGGYKYSAGYDTREEAEAAVQRHEKDAYSEVEKTGLGIWSDLRTLGLYGLGSPDKFIPESYLVNSVEVRLGVLQGLMDTDGTVDATTGMPSYTSTSKRLADDVVRLVESLGGACTVTTKQPPNGKLAYTCWIRYNDSPSLFRLDRKKEIAKVRTKYPVKRMLLSIEPVGVKPCQCITVDNPDGLYLTDRYVVTHNSVACLVKLAFLCENVPNLRCLMVRKTRTSLSESGLVTWEQKVLGPKHPALAEGGKRSHRKNYIFPNGSTVVVAGMDQPSKVLSTEFDIIFCQEAIELEEGDWETLISRNRNFKLGYQQIIADTNPDTPSHWIKKRAEAGKLHLIESHHEDNPLLFDPQKNEWTSEGRRYLEALDQLTGPRFLRLRRGVWCQAEGAVYEDFDRGVHVVDSCHGHPYPPPEWTRYLSIDFGFTNAFVCHFCAADPDGRLWVYRQWIKSQMLVEDHAKQIKVMMAEEDRYLRHQIIQRRKEMIERLGESEGARWMVNSIGELPRQLRPRAVICDHDAEDRATLERHLGMTTKAANKQIRAGIQAVASRLRKQGDGRPRLYILRDSVGKPDANMVAKKLPVGIAEEMEGYVWDVESGRKKGEEPVGKNDHSMDALRYVVAELDLSKRGVAEVWS